jgi:FkbM family methyltransferase
MKRPETPHEREQMSAIMRGPNNVTEDMIPIITVPTKHGDIFFYCSGTGSLNRALSFHSKEPETLEWIDTFQAGDVLWDIGANIGCYTLYAAVKGHRVLAFEPSAFNFFGLSKNLFINRFDKFVDAYCLAFNNNASLSAFNVNCMGVADAGNYLAPINDTSANFRQAVMTLSVDDFVRCFNPDFPTHIKIDVDGVEAGIVQGAMKTLCDNRLKSVLIEVDDSNPADQNIVRMLNYAGLEMISRGRAPQFSHTPIWNCVFTRATLKE